MNQVLSKCIDTICLERDSKWDESFNCVDQVISEFGEENLAERIFEDTPRTIPFEVISDILNIAIWSTSDNGTRIQKTAEKWLVEKSDSRKMLVALTLDIFPFKSRKEAGLVLKDLPDKLRAVDPYVAKMLDAWEKQENA